MHEMSIAQALLEIVEQEMQRHGARRLNSVTVQVGEMTAVVPEALTFCFQVMISGTQFEGARLLVEVVPLQGRCRDCGREFRIENYTFICPQCGGREIDASQGQDLSVVELEVEGSDTGNP